MSHPLLRLLMCAALALALPSNAAAEDRAAPSLALPSDPISRAPRWLVAASARAPLQRSYSIVLGYVATRHLALEARVGVDEKQRLEVGAGLALRPLGGRLEGPLLRGGVSYRAASPTNAAEDGELRLDAIAGGSFVVSGAYVEAGAGILAGSGTAGGRWRPDFVLEARLGLVF